MDVIIKATEKTAIRRWLSVPDASVNYNAAISLRQEGTGSQFLKSEPFEKWNSCNRISFLWLYGKAGCGKTFLSTSIIEHLTTTCDTISTSGALAYFYFDFQDHAKKTHSNMLRSIAFQLCSKDTTMWAELYKLHQSNNQGNSQPSDNSIEAIIFKCLGHFQNVWLVLDALDECDIRHDSLAWLQKLLKERPKSLRLLVTSRDEEDIRQALCRSAEPQEVISIEDILNADIEIYVHARLFESSDFQKWNGHDALSLIETEIMQKVDSMFVYYINLSIIEERRSNF